MIDTALREALSKLHKAVERGAPFQLAILDYHMPGMDGDELARAIKANEELKDTPLVLLTSGAQRGDAGKYRQMGFSAYLSKPVLVETLRQVLSSTLGAAAEKRQGMPLITRHRVAESAARKAAKHRFHGKILLAEDVLANQMVASTMLKQHGVEVDVARDGEEALELWQNADYDLIFMDCQMPVMDGFEATRRIRGQEQSQARHTPIIALTANAMAQDRQQCLEVGMDDFIPKPFEREDLVSVLEKWLGTRRPEAGKTGEVKDANPAVDTYPVVDRKRLDLLRESMGDEFEGLIPVFIDNISQLLGSFCPAAEESRREEIRALARSIESASEDIGAMAMARMAQELEGMASEGTQSEIHGCIAALEAGFERVRKELE